MGWRNAIFLGVGLFIIGFVMGWWVTGIGNVSPDLMAITSFILGFVFGSYGWQYGMEHD